MTTGSPINSRADSCGLQDLCGSIVAIVTPMKDEFPHDVDVKALEDLVKWHVNEGTQAIVAVGTTGESATLSDDEWEIVVKTCIQAANRRIPVIAGSGTNCTASSIRKTMAACRLGADACLVVAPYYNKPTQEGIYTHMKSIATSCPQMPIILYNVPSRTIVDILPSTTARLACDCVNIIGTKEATTSVERFAEVRKLTSSQFRIYCGEDATCMAAIYEGGANGVISVTANVVPSLMQTACEIAMQKQRSSSHALFDNGLAPLHSALFVEPSPTATKWLLQHLNKIPGGIRLPLLPLSLENAENVKNAFEAVASNHELTATTRISTTTPTTTTPTTTTTDSF